MELLQKMGNRAKGLGDKAKDLTSKAQDIRKRSSGLLEATKLKFELSKLEKEMENNLAGIGLLVYQHHNGEEDLQAEIDRLLEATKELEEEAKALEDQIANLQPKVPVCPECEQELPTGGIYCSYCGLKVLDEENRSE
ncbi:MAG: zinc ribbon domain-containing protein [Firmicutes bacterium]|nr:zinc ribbon domain-containing protein [Bacillota bacterium]